MLRANASCGARTLPLLSVHESKRSLALLFAFPMAIRFRWLFVSDGYAFLTRRISRFAFQYRNSSGMQSIPKRRALLFALLPALLVGTLHGGWQMNLWFNERPDVFAVQNSWQFLIAGEWVQADPASLRDNFVRGAVYMVPMVLIACIVAGMVELFQATRQQRAIDAGFVTTALLYVLLLPLSLPLEWVAVGMLVGAMAGAFLTQSSGRPMLHPAAVGAVFLLFAAPDRVTGDTVWTPVDGVSGTTALGLVRQGGLDTLTAAGFSWWDCFVGKTQGAMGDVSSLALLGGVLILLAARVFSWRYVVGSVLGLVLISLVLKVFANANDPLVALPWYWQIALGGWTFAVFYLVADPLVVQFPARLEWFYGGLASMLLLLGRVFNPAYPDGALFAVLLLGLISGLLGSVVYSPAAGARTCVGSFLSGSRSCRS
ncbi:Na(+)-translocating NADH-quinone reductase subunit B [gamma proteobacterium HdN1]|nr:Na(+)-translocating NADH-quinone reductase subunit B [gamma proteobacterium HdN1]